MLLAARKIAARFPEGRSASDGLSMDLAMMLLTSIVAASLGPSRVLPPPLFASRRPPTPFAQGRRLRHSPGPSHTSDVPPARLAIHRTVPPAGPVSTRQRRGRRKILRGGRLYWSDGLWRAGSSPATRRRPPRRRRRQADVEWKSRRPAGLGVSWVQETVCTHALGGKRLTAMLGSHLQPHLRQLPSVVSSLSTLGRASGDLHKIGRASCRERVS